MKKITFLLFFILVAMNIAMAQETVFSKRQQAEEAYIINFFVYYVPHDTSGFRPLGKNEALLKLTEDKIFEANIIGGRKFAIFEKGTIVVINKHNGNIIRIWKCGNIIYAVYDIPKKNSNKKNDNQIADIDKGIQQDIQQLKIGVKNQTRYLQLLMTQNKNLVKLIKNNNKNQKTVIAYSGYYPSYSYYPNNYYGYSGYGRIVRTPFGAENNPRRK